MENIKKMLKEYKGEKSYIKNIFEYKSQKLDKYTLDDNGFISIFEHSFDVLKESLEYINNVDKNKWNDGLLTQYLFLFHNIESLYSTFDGLIYGLNRSATLNLRSSFETLMRIYFISFYSNNFYGVTGGNLDNRKDYKRFQLTDFINNDLKNDWQKIYKILSKDSHSNSLVVLNHLKKYSTGEKIIQKFTLDNKIIDINFHKNILIMIIYAYLRIINNLFFDKFLEGKIDIKIKNNIELTLEGLSELLNSVDESKHDNYYKDIELIMKKINKLS